VPLLVGAGGRRRLVRHQGQHLLGVTRGKLQPDGGATTAAEDVRRFVAEQGEEAVGVIGVRLHPLSLPWVLEPAARQPPAVVGQDGVPVGKVVGDRVEGMRVATGGVDQEQDRAGAAHLVVEACSRHP